MSLLSMTQLQVVFKITEELVSFSQIVMVLAADMASVMQFLQCEKGSARPKPSFLATINSLQTLGQELNIPNPSGVELYVNGTHWPELQRFDPTSPVDPFPGFKRSLDGREVHIWP